MLKRCYRLRYLFCILLLLILSVVSFTMAGISIDAVWPENGNKIAADESLTVDYSHSDEGYVMVKGKKSKSRLKLRITFGKEVMTYDLNQNGDYEVFPLQYGSGRYRVVLYRNTSGKKYVQDGEVSVNAKMIREDAAFLGPNQYVRYTEDMAVVKKGAELCEGLSSGKKIVEAVRKYVSSTYVYDYIQATLVGMGVLPDIERCYERRMGICQDLSALAVCILRTQGIPARLMIGYADSSYHAWVCATVDGQDYQFDPTVDINAMGKPTKYTLERYY